MNSLMNDLTLAQKYVLIFRFLTDTSNRSISSQGNIELPSNFEIIAK
jgi:hypothetical protein